MGDTIIETQNRRFEAFLCKYFRLQSTSSRLTVSDEGRQCLRLCFFEHCMVKDRNDTMNPSLFISLVAKGEDSKIQFKENIRSTERLAREMVAFSNSMGGQIFIGVSDIGEIKGLSDEDINRINQMISNAATQHVRPPIHPKTEIIEYENRKVIVLSVLCGADRPYCTNKGIYLTKSGADKRQISSDEMRRLFQESGRLRADETVFPNTDWNDIDSDLFFRFFEKKYKEPVSDKAEIPRLFENLNLAADGKCNLSGMLLFGKNVSKYYLLNQLICISFFGNDIAGTQYRDSENIEGNVRKLFKEGMAFISRNLKKIQNGQSVNSLGEPEVPLIVFEELLVNALIHRDYFVSGNIRILIFDDRIEIASPGKLPNNLTVEKIKRGVSIKRNQTLASFAFDVLNFRGIGSGILRALSVYPDISFVNDEDIEQFAAVVRRTAWA